MSHWPSLPIADGSAPSLLEVAADPAVAAHARVLMAEVRRLEATGGVRVRAFQTVLASPVGPVTLPCLLERAGGDAVLVSHSGAWDGAVVKRLLEWGTRVRAALPDADLLLACDEDHEAAARVRDAFARTPRARLALLALPLVDDDPARDAAALAAVVRSLTGRTLAFSRAGVEELDLVLDGWLGAVPDGFALRSTLIRLVGAFVGQALVEGLGGSWTSAPPHAPAWVRQVVVTRWQQFASQSQAAIVDGVTLNPCGRASRSLRDPREKLVDLYDLAEHGGVPIDLRCAGADEVSPTARRQIYRVLGGLAAADGEVDAAERATLERWRLAFGIGRAEAAGLEREAEREALLGLSREEGVVRVLVQGVIEVVTADGALRCGERRGLRRVCQTIGVPVEELTALVECLVKARAA